MLLGLQYFSKQHLAAGLLLQAFPVVGICLKQLRNVLTNSREGWTRLIAGGITIDRLQVVYLSTICPRVRIFQIKLLSVLQFGVILITIKRSIVKEL